MSEVPLAPGALRAVFVYPNSRRQLSAELERGVVPDSTLLGQNHLAEWGIAARTHDPLLTRHALHGPLARVAWTARELMLPWEVGDADVLFTPLGQTLPLVARLRRRPRVVVVNYGFNTVYGRSSRSRRRLLRASLGSAARVVCLGEWQREQLLELTGLPTERLRTALLGIDERFFAPRPALAGEPYILSVGKDLARDYATLALALDGLDVRAELAVYPRNLTGITFPPGVRARVVGPLELRDLYAGAACVVLPQRRDGYPLGTEGGGLTALLEAMAMGKPIIASDRLIMRDYVEDGIEVLTVPPEDPGALRAAIERVLGDTELATRLGAAARDRVELSLTTRHFAGRIAPILHEVASEHRPRARRRSDRARPSVPSPDSRSGSVRGL